MADVTTILASSRIYKSFSDSRKHFVVQAASNPINTKLVQQLVSYLDPEYRKDQYISTEPRNDPEPDSLDLSDDFDNAEDFSNDPSPRSSEPLDSGPVRSTPDLPSGSPMDSEVPSVEDDLGVNIVEDLPEPEEEISEATDIDTEDISTTVKNILESDESTSGVTRVALHDDDNELWVYYNDKTNLNRIMSNVVDQIENHNLGLIFNRLARMDNAIVFEK